MASFSLFRPDACPALDFQPYQEMVDAYKMADGWTLITGYTNNGLTLLSTRVGIRGEGYVETAQAGRYSAA